MVKEKKEFSTGISSLDEVLHGVWAGDNVVWHVDEISDYLPFVHAFCQNAYREKRKLIYFRFAQHFKILPEDIKAEVFKLNPEQGFENFLFTILTVIEKYGKGACYVFDCLSWLSADWYSDQMLANFFMITCPYLYDFETATYFVLQRERHTQKALNIIHSTAQIVIEIYRKDKEVYLQPVKVYKRYSRTMYMLHDFKDDILKPVFNSTVISEIHSQIQQTWIDLNLSYNDVWASTFQTAQKIEEKYARNQKTNFHYQNIKRQLIRMTLTKDERLQNLCEKVFSLSDLITIGKRMIGSGLIGGKSIGMLLARAILEKHAKKWKILLETHDSFFVGSNVFYTYIIQNDCFWERQALLKESNFLDNADNLRQKLLHGNFPEDIIDQFKEMLNYFGQSPIIVRSSSLLEDSYGNAFSGKYESIFCANQGTPEERLKNFLSAVKRVYASTMSRDALNYRAFWGLLGRDEQMALLIQRVSGNLYHDLYFPHIAGVGYSYNPFVWNSKIDPRAGVLRLVFGLGTRAVERRDDDYTRIVALNVPQVRPETTMDEVRKYTQQRVDVLNLSKNILTTIDFAEIIKNNGKLPLDIFSTRDFQLEKRAKELGLKDILSWILTFEKLLTHTQFVTDMREMLNIIEDTYEHPVDIEFAANFLNEDQYKINLLQCRPFKTEELSRQISFPDDINEEQIILKTAGPIIGLNTLLKIHKIIYVIPAKYGLMTLNERSTVARLIGELTITGKNNISILLLGPGRWGTTMPALGIPVSFSEIKNVKAICEIVELHDNLIPDVSLGTHFFNDIVEMQIIYMALFPNRDNYFLNLRVLDSAPNHLLEIVPDAQKFKDLLKVIDIKDISSNAAISLLIDALNQKGLAYL